MTWRSVLLALLLGGSAAGALAYALGRPAASMSAQLAYPDTLAASSEPRDEPLGGAGAESILLREEDQERRLERVRAEAIAEVSRWHARKSSEHKSSE